MMARQENIYMSNKIVQIITPAATVFTPCLVEYEKGGIIQEKGRL
jgi:hypothetical protein